jgi:FAD/FMN-containing dehydrogenase
LPAAVAHGTAKREELRRLEPEEEPMAACGPLSAHELCEAVRKGAAYDASRLDRVLQVDTARGLVEVQAHTPWKVLAAELSPADGRARELPTTRPTIGQSIAWNAAGPDGRPCVEHVESLTLVSSEGQLRRLNRSSHSALFGLVVGGHDAFGALYSVTLRIESLARAVAEAETQAPSEATAAGSRPLQLLVPPQALEACLSDVRAHCAEWRVPLESVRVRPIHCENETFLRWAPSQCAEITLLLGERCTLGGSVRSTQLRRELIDLAIARGGGFPIACTPEATRAQTQACYPQLAGFLAEQRRVDPHERWAGAWLRHQRGLLERQSCEVRWSI